MPGLRHKIQHKWGKSMITVTVSPNKYQLGMKGHAGYDEIGKDIICASASMVYYNLCQMMLEYDEGKAFCKKPEMQFTSGKAFLKVVPRKEYEPWIQHDFLYAVKGFQLLAAQYPEYVCLKILNY